MRCSMCGHDSPVGSLFCLNCGSQLAAGYGARTPAPPPGLPGGRCPSCGADNPGNMKFCRNCGTGLAAPAGAPALGGGNPPGPPPYAPGAAGGPSFPPPAAAPTPFAPPYAPPPHGAPAPTPALGGSGSPISAGKAVICPRCGSQTPAGFAFCQQCGVQLPAADPQAATVTGAGGDAVQAGSIPRPPAGAPGPAAPVTGAPRSAPTTGAPPIAASAWGVAISVNRDGSDGERFQLVAEYVTIGRTGCDVAFDQDRFLARNHARLEKSGEAVRVVPLDQVNGVFRKLDAPVELTDSAVVLVGREVLRYETLDADERATEPLVRHGVALFGSPPREPWARLLQLLPSGGVRDVRHLWGDEVVLGREEGDIVFRDDAFMSRRHAAITWDGRRAMLTDLGSSNGTFVRLAGPTAVRHGDQLRMGDQLFRFELRR